MTLKKLLGSLALGAILIAPFGKTLHAAETSGSTRIKVTLPQIIILHYISEISLDFTTDLSTTIDEGSGSWTTAWDGINTGGTAELTTGNLDDRPTFELEGHTTISTSVPNVWAVRGLAENGEATVSITDNGTTLTHTHDNGSDTIELSGFTISSAGENTGTTMDVALNGIARADATLGDVNFTMDLVDADSAGDYENTEVAEFEYTITTVTI